MMSVVSFFVLFHLLSFATINISFCSGSTYNAGCIQTERQALLTFKHHLSDPSNRLASWTQAHPDCCNWVGVLCHNITGHVLQLNLQNPHSEVFSSDYSYTEYFTTDYFPVSDEENEAAYKAYNTSKLGGKINRSLLDLKYLVHLDLSFNDFQGIQIPKFLASMENLRYLNLSHAEFVGMIPQQLGNLSNLQYLDFSRNYDLYVENLMWISGLTLLRHLDLSGINLNNTYNHWLPKISSLLFLEKLGLSNCQLQHSSQISIANFSSLTTLDLSNNCFVNSFIPSWVFGLRHLVFLDLTSNCFQGLIPNGLKNLTSLRHLDLLGNSFNSSIPDWFYGFSHLEYLSLRSNNLQGSISSGFKNLTSLRHLDLSCNNFNSSIPYCLYGFSHLEYLSLRSNNLQGSISSGLKNLTSLRHLDLSYNNFNSSILYCLYGFSHLEYLSLRSNNLQGSISSALGNLTSIITLDLSSNKLDGRIPTSLGRLCNLRSITMSYVNLSQNMNEIFDILSGCVANRLESLVFGNNQLSGHLTNQLRRFKNLKILDLQNNSISSLSPSSLWELSSLRSLDLSKNKLNGTLSQIHFSNLTRLVQFLASDNSQIVVKVNSDWIPPFQLRSLGLGSCNMGPHFPLWLKSQKHLANLDISNNGISDNIPDWFWRSLSQFSSLNLSHNHFHQKIPNFTDAGSFFVLDLSSNKFFGPLPHINPNVLILDLSNNTFSGSIFQFLCYGMNESKTTSILNLENNSLSGELPNCWMNWKELVALNLGNNHFSGTLPTSIGNLTFLFLLNLRKNNLSGVLPIVSLKNCTNLVVLDVAENQFVGNILTCIGERFSRMRILILRSNNFHGLLPMELCRLSSLQILDLAYNNFFGNIPSCIANVSAMVTMDNLESTHIFYFGIGSILGKVNFDAHEVIMRIGKEYEYSSILNLVRAIDLSENNFSGRIPREVTNLRALQYLNLSYNSLTGRIPENIGAMKDVEFIDFSSNQLSGEIPQSIASLTFLHYLDVANNNLSGKIPLSTQIQGLNASYFTGNDLCGSPLPHCVVTVETLEHENGDGKDGNEHEVDWLYVSMALGFVMGFWGFIGSLLINRRWRYMYSAFLNRLEDKIYIYFAVRKWCF